MTYKHHSTWIAHLYTPAGRLASKVTFVMPPGSTSDDVLAKVEHYKYDRPRTFTLEGKCRLNKTKLTIGAQ